ncbi:Protein of unknown function (DUF 659) [Nesidiocoris tenuis]|uniref:Uncharacterized protein n=1 Tax=Nesidiocoris tenuis TaxID=355587 RepID=A0ABN7AIQ3_9HEMI|nr:Protein of unknown function (DUF 659) [Nesidiocoris tenuis]
MKICFWATCTQAFWPTGCLCLSGSKSWYKFKKAEGQRYHHDINEPPAICQELKPIFSDLANDQLLPKCLHGEDPKGQRMFQQCAVENDSQENFCWPEMIKFGVQEGVPMYNDGNISRCRDLHNLGIELGANLLAD